MLIAVFAKQILKYLNCKITTLQLGVYVLVFNSYQRSLADILLSANLMSFFALHLSFFTLYDIFKDCLNRSRDNEWRCTYIILSRITFLTHTACVSMDYKCYEKLPKCGKFNKCRNIFIVIKNNLNRGITNSNFFEV